MEIIKKEIELTDDFLEYFPKNALFFDIETLGLSPKYCPIYLIGCMELKESTPLITLFFAEKSDEEEKLLLAFYQYIKNFDTIITFNGEAFDIPFVKKRGELINLYFDFDRFNRIDLYKEVKKVKNMLSLSRLNQKSLENFLGIYRKDQYGGGELINVYYRYEQTADDALKELLILHNFEDVEGMGYLLSLLSYVSFYKGNFTIEKTEFVDFSDTCQIIFSGSLNMSVPKTVHILGENIHIKATGKEFFGSIDLFKTPLKLFHKNVKDYYYIISENLLVHKSIAMTLSKDKIKKATKENCFSLCEGYFCKLPDDKKFKSLYNFSNEPIYRTDFSDKTPYVMVMDKKNNRDESRLLKFYDLIQALILYSFS